MRLLRKYQNTESVIYWSFFEIVPNNRIPEIVANNQIRNEVKQRSSLREYQNKVEQSGLIYFFNEFQFPSLELILRKSWILVNGILSFYVVLAVFEDLRVVVFVKIIL